MMEADDFWLQQALNNLIDNAIDFSSNQAQLSIYLYEEKDHVLVQIFNEAEAIPEYALDQIFERYFSLPRPISKQRSSGIGLSIVKNVVEQHHGNIHINNIDVNQLDYLDQHHSGVLVSLKIPKKFT